MRAILPLVCLLLVSCATSVTAPSPVHDGDIVVPRYTRLFHERIDRSRYVAGFKDGWRTTVEAFAKDIDHQRDFREDVGGADTSFWEGWRDARSEIEARVHRLVDSLGKAEAQEKLRAIAKK